jgi:hypothetical protein
MQSFLKVPPILQLNGDRLDYTEDYSQKFGKGESFSRVFGIKSRHGSVNLASSPKFQNQPIDPKHFSHVDVMNVLTDFDVFDTCRHGASARDWPDSRKRFAACVVCVNTISVGILLGIYAGEVPAIQYAIADFGHFSILGNVVLYSGLAVSTLVC